MKNKIVLIVIFMFLSSFETHKYYVSTSLFEYKKSMNSLHVTIRVFEDDFINVLNKNYNKDLDLDSDLNESNIKQNISDYLMLNLHIYTKNQKLLFTYLGSEEKNDTTALYIEIENLRNPKSIQIKNTMLFDTFNDQQNIIHFKSSLLRKSFLLSKDSDTISIDL